MAINIIIHPDWNTLSSNFQVFALLPENVNAANINNQLLKFSKDHYNRKRSFCKIQFSSAARKLHFDNRFEIFGNHVTSMSDFGLYRLSGFL